MEKVVTVHSLTNCLMLGTKKRGTLLCLVTLLPSDGNACETLKPFSISLWGSEGSWF